MIERPTVEQAIMSALVMQLRIRGGLAGARDTEPPLSGFRSTPLPYAWVCEDGPSLPEGDMPDINDVYIFRVLPVIVRGVCRCKDEQDAYVKARALDGVLQAAVFTDQTLGGLALWSEYTGSEVGPAAESGLAGVEQRWSLHYQRLRMNPYAQQVDGGGN